MARNATTQFSPPTRYVASSHALERWEERFPGLSFHLEFQTGVAWGIQRVDSGRRSSQLFLSKCGAVFVVEHCDVSIGAWQGQGFGRVVTTVLTEEQAKANASQRFGVKFPEQVKTSPASFPPSLPDQFDISPPPPITIIDRFISLSLADKQTLRDLAISHVAQNKMGKDDKKWRNAQLREMGFDPSSLHGEFYRDRFNEAAEEKFREIRKENTKIHPTIRMNEAERAGA